MPGKYILARDERGTKTKTSTRRTFTVGGFATAESNRTRLIYAWEDIRYRLCGDRSVELKWSHFFPGKHQQNSINPLKSKNQTEWPALAIQALEELFERANLFPITTVVPKDRASESLYELTPAGKSVLSLSQILAATLGQFALYMMEKNGQKGEIWFDNLGSEKEEEELQTKFANIFTNLSNLDSPHYQKIVKRISPQIRFYNSKNEPFVQIADFVSGVIGASAEGDNRFFEPFIEKYAPGKRRTYGILTLEA